jgi:hypothetical protein
VASSRSAASSPKRLKHIGCEDSRSGPQALLLEELVRLRPFQPILHLLQDGGRQEVRSGRLSQVEFQAAAEDAGDRRPIRSASAVGAGARPLASRHSDAIRRAFLRNSVRSVGSATWNRASAARNAAASACSPATFCFLAASIANSSIRGSVLRHCCLRSLTVSNGTGATPRSAPVAPVVHGYHGHGGRPASLNENT